MPPSERVYISLCKQRIEEKFQFETENGTLRQRDLDYLADRIDEQSGIRLSLSTLKRLWRKDYDQTPHPTTLQALVSVLGHENWQAFKATESSVSADSTPVVSSKNKPQFASRWMLFPTLFLAAAGIGWLVFRAKDLGKEIPVINGPVSFVGNKTLTLGVPNTVVFTYDLSHVEADSFFFQQSWDMREKVKIDPKGRAYSTIYYYPGFHQAKLIANDSVIKRFPVHVTTNGWLPLVHNAAMDDMPVYVKKNRPITNGALHATPNDLMLSSIDMNRDFVLSYYNVQPLNNTWSDNFSLDTRFVCDSSNRVVCPYFQVVIMCETDIFFVTMTNKGCETKANLQLGEVFQDGVHHDLAALGRDLYQWQHLQIKVAHKKATLYLNEQPVYTFTFRKDFGRLVGLTYNFNTTGAIDDVKVMNGQNKLVLEDEFGK